VDGTDEVIVNHPNTAYEALEAIEAKLGATGDAATGFGGVSFDSAGVAANPGAVGDPTLWIDNTGGPGFPLMYTDEVGTDFNLMSLALSPGVGTGYTCTLGTVVGELMYISADDTVLVADATVGNSARGMVISVYGAGVVCDIMYIGEVTNSGWALTAGSTYYLTTAGGFATAPPALPIVIQEIGFARNPTTLVFRPTVEST
jgi:hypothetical protein